MKIRGILGVKKVEVIPVDGSYGQKRYEEIVNNPAIKVLHEQTYGSSLGDIKIIIKYRDMSEKLGQIRDEDE